jgi:hypothetical protein
MNTNSMGSLTKLRDLPLNVASIYYQPTTGRFYKDSEEIIIDCITIVDISPVNVRLIVEQDGRVIISRRMADDHYTAEEFDYVKEMLDQEGYITYETNTLSFAGNVSFKVVTRTKDEVRLSNDRQDVLAIVNINSGTHIPSMAFSSLLTVLDKNLTDDMAVAEISLEISIDDEPFTTLKTNRQIYPLGFSYKGKSEDEVIKKITREKGGVMAGNILSEKLKSQNKSTFSSMAEIISPLKIESIDSARLEQF